MGGTDGLDDGVLDDPLLALFAAARRDAAGRVPPRALAQLEVHAHPQVFEQSVEHLQHRGACGANTVGGGKDGTTEERSLSGSRRAGNLTSTGTGKLLT